MFTACPCPCPQVSNHSPDFIFPLGNPQFLLSTLTVQRIPAMARTRSMGASGAVNGNGNKTSQNGSIGSNGSTTVVKKPTLSERTDYTRWRLLDERGRQTWHYLEDDEDAKEWPQSTADKYFLGQPLVCTTISTRSSHLFLNRFSRTCLNFRRSKRRSTQSGTVSNSSSISNFLQETGPANMEGQCFCFRDLS